METSAKKKGGFERFITAVEVIGNKLPHPFWLFISLIGIVMVLSYFLSKAGVSVTYLQAARSAADAPKEATVVVKNLLSIEAIRGFFTNFVSTYSGFAPMGLVMIMMMGIGIMEQSGMLSALMRGTILGVPPSLVVAVLAFVGVNANLASDAGVVVVPAIGGAIFKSLGRNPWIGVIAGYAAANGGFEANMLLAGTDALIAGITESVTKATGIIAPVHPLMNWYFMFTASWLLIGATVFVTKYFTEKHLGDNGVMADSKALEEHLLTDVEKKGLRYSGIAILAYVLLIVVLTVPQGSLFRAPNGDIIPRSPLLSSIVPILFFAFAVVGIAYGKVTGSIKKLADIPKLMAGGVSQALGFLVIALPAATFISMFGDSNITTIIGVKGGKILQAMNLGGLPLLFIFIIGTMVMNLFITAGSSKWLILSPIFVPMFAMLGMAPALTQISYRIADSCTNIISPVDYYVPVIMGLLEIFKPEGKEVGIGTVISLTLPYSIAYFIAFFLLLTVWYLFGLPLGPGVPSFM